MAGWKALSREKGRPWQPLSALQKVTKGPRAQLQCRIFRSFHAKSLTPPLDYRLCSLAWLDYSGERFSLEVGLLASTFCRGLLS
jgi:hypothetical protein